MGQERGGVKKTGRRRRAKEDAAGVIEENRTRLGSGSGGVARLAAPTWGGRGGKGTGRGGGVEKKGEARTAKKERRGIG